MKVNSNKQRNLSVPYILMFLIPSGLLIYTAIHTYNSPDWIAGTIVSILLTALLLNNYFYVRKSQRKNTLEKRTILTIIKEKVFDDGRAIDKFIGDNLSIQLESVTNNVVNFIKQIGDGNLDVEFEDYNENNKALNEGTLVGELFGMKSKMKGLAKAENQRNWIAEGVAKFSSIFREQKKSLNEILDEFIMELSKYVNANQGSVFILNEDTNLLELRACYAYNRKKYIDQKVEPGQGLIGQAFLEQESIYLREVPQNYVKITSGLGEATPSVIYIAPLKHNEQVVGVMEIAAFKEWSDHEKKFINKVAEIAASAVAAINTNLTTKNLLEESQEKGEQLHAQEEELRQNLEEISATQEEMERKSKEALEQNKKLNAILDSSISPILTINEDGKVLTINNATTRLLGYSEKDLIGQNVKIIVPSPHHDKHDQYLKDYHNTGKKKIIGIKRRVEARKKDGSLTPIEIAVNEADLGGSKIYTAILRDISENVKMEEQQLKHIEELKYQKNELQQYMEELQSTQEQVNEQLTEVSHLNREMDARSAVLNESTIVSEADLYGNIIYVNKKFCTVSQYLAEELIGQPHKIVRHSDMPKEVFKLLWSTIKQGKVFRGYVKNRKKDGTPYYVDAVISPVLDDKGKPEKYIGVRYVIEDPVLGEKLLAEQNQKLNIKQPQGVK